METGTPPPWNAWITSAFQGFPTRGGFDSMIFQLVTALVPIVPNGPRRPVYYGSGKQVAPRPAGRASLARPVGAGRRRGSTSGGRSVSCRIRQQTCLTRATEGRGAAPRFSAAPCEIPFGVAGPPVLRADPTSLRVPVLRGRGPRTGAKAAGQGQAQREDGGAEAGAGTTPAIYSAVPGHRLNGGCRQKESGEMRCPCMLIWRPGPTSITWVTPTRPSGCRTNRAGSMSGSRPSATRSKRSSAHAMKVRSS